MVCHNQLFLTVNNKKHTNTNIFIILITFVFVKYVLSCWKKIKYIPITLYTTSLYSHFVEQLLIINNCNYFKIYTPYNNNISYYTNKNKEVLLTPHRDQFINTIVDFIPLTNDELCALETHTHLNDLDKVQHELLSVLPKINAYQIVNHNYIESDNYNISIDKIKNVSFVNNFYYITTPNNVFCTKIILTDYVSPLKAGDVINYSYYNEEEDKIYTDSKYILDDQFKLIRLRKKLNKGLDELPFARLNEPRHNLSLHPFCLPHSNDIVLSILIVTQKLIHLFNL